MIRSKQKYTRHARKALGSWSARAPTLTSTPALGKATNAMRLINSRAIGFASTSQKNWQAYTSLIGCHELSSINKGHQLIFPSSSYACEHIWLPCQLIRSGVLAPYSYVRIYDILADIIRRYCLGLHQNMLRFSLQALLWHHELEL